MTFWLLLTVNSVTFGGLLFLLSAGFSLIFGLMRIPNLTHGSMFMLGAYFGVTLIGWGCNFWIAALGAGLGVALFGGIIERCVLRRLVGAELARQCQDRSRTVVSERTRRIPEERSQS